MKFTHGVSVAVIRQNSVLIVKRANSPYRGFWSLPGGRVENGETNEEAAKRELFEETGLQPNALSLILHHIPPVTDPNQRRYKIAVFLCRQFTGTPRAGADAEQLQWRGTDELQSVRLTPGTARIIRRATTIGYTRN